MGGLGLPEERLKAALRMEAQRAYDRLYAVEFGTQVEQFKVMLPVAGMDGFTSVDALGFLHSNVERMRFHGTPGAQERYLSTTFYFRDGSCYKFRNTQVGEYLDLSKLPRGSSEGVFLKSLEEFAAQSGYYLC